MANNLNISINLLKMKAGVLTIKNPKTGVAKKCVVLPIEDNDLASKVSDDGKVSIYLGLTAWEHASQYGDTHLVKQSHTEEWNNSHTKEQQQAEPILGNARPVKEKTIEQVNVPEAEVVPQDDDSDLPF